MSSSNRAVLSAVDRVAQPLILRDTSVTVSFSGDLRAAGVPVMRLHLLSLACEDGPEEIVVDLSGVTWLDRDGVEPLVEAHRLQTFRGAALRLTQISSPAARFLKSQPRLAQVLGRSCAPSAPSAPDNSWRRFPPENGEPDSWAPIPDDAEVRALHEEIASLREALAGRDPLSRSRSQEPERDR
ncbi:hypothetical protein GCM10022223_16440 [Kineosporia mesophila]|uniref:STAS domain-containing protein n=1 Tax=Kineosporia mesophila TaxID=566012 RepID=A0ABP6ZA22_9ACTN|nr:STAS domain-containing protein [Kineosporia mesophila]MCD5352118.1 STAS domain-containing protein [Kineosporia mesophila]